MPSIKTRAAGAIAVLSLSFVVVGGCTAARSGGLAPLAEDAAPELTEPYTAADTAYRRCVESYSGHRIPWQLFAAGGTGAASVTLLAAAAASPVGVGVVMGSTPNSAITQGIISAVLVGTFGTFAVGSGVATAWFASQLPTALDRAKVEDKVLGYAETTASDAATAGDGEALGDLARDLYEDCRVASASTDANGAGVIIRDLQRYRREAEEAESLLADVTGGRDEATGNAEKLTESLADAENRLKKADARAEGHEARIAEIEEKRTELEAENGSLRTELTRLEDERAQLSAKQKALLEEKRKLEAKTSQYEDVAKALEAEVKNGKVALRRLRNGVVVELPNKVLFPSGKAELDERGNETLTKVAEAIKGLKNRRIRVEGHTDNVPVGKRSDFKSNWDLSSARAIAVTEHLQQNGVSPALMSAEARSQYAPAASNRTPRGRARNRRIEIYLVDKTSGAGSSWKPEKAAPKK